MRARLRRPTLACRERAASAALAVLAALTALTSVGCNVEQAETGSAESDYASEEGDAVRIALARADAPLAGGALDSLAQDGIVPDPQPKIGGLVSRELVTGLRGEAGAEEWYGATASGGVVRIDGFTLRSAFSRTDVATEGKRFTLPFAASAGARVEFAKVYPDERAAVTAPRPGLWSIPADAERALALPEGTYVTIPVRGEITKRASGSFLSLASVASRPMLDLLSASSTGHLSAGAQGVLVARGELTIEVIRLPRDRVRLRVGSRRAVEASGSVEAGGRAAAQLMLVPASPLERARAIAGLAAKGLGAEEQWRGLDARVAALEATVAPELRKLLAARTELARRNAALRASLERAHAVADPAIVLATRPGSDIGELEERAYRRVDGMLAAIDPALSARLPDLDAPLRRLVDHTLAVGASVRLSAELEAKATRLGDYVIDLGTDEGREAYDHAVSGRALWLSGSRALAPGWALGGHSVSDLTLADALADEDFATASPRVVRLSSIEDDLRRDHLGVSFAGLGASASFDRSHAEQSLVTVDPSGKRTEVTAHLAELAQSQSVVGSRRSERYVSGFVTLKGSEDPARGAYWFRWEAAMGGASDPVARALAGATNLLGPRAVDLGVPLLYDGERPGNVRVALDVVLSGSVVDAFFRAPRPTLWKALGDMAETYDNQFGLPRLGGFAAGNEVPEADGERAACDKVARAWGTFYCGYFRDRFAELPRVSPEGRLAYFRPFYDKALLANPVGSKILVRFLSQVLRELGVDDGVRVRLVVSNDRDPSLGASPTLGVGEGPEVDLALAILGSMRRG